MEEARTLAPSETSWDWEQIRVRCLREARRMLRCERDAEEAVQEALLRAWRSQAKQREHGSELGWVLQITRNEALRSLSKRQRRPELMADALPEPRDGDDGTVAVLDAVAVRAALDELAAEDAMLLRLRYEQDLTQPRVAELAGLPEGTVKVRLHRLRGRLRERLSDEL